MKTPLNAVFSRRIALPLLLISLASVSLYAADEGLDTNVKLKQAGDGQDTSIMIKKGAPPQKEKRYEIIGDTEELVGDPGNSATAYGNWKKACEDWKTEIKSLNNQPDHSIISLSCGVPKAQKSPEMIYTYTSSARYKARVLMVEPVSGK